MTLLNTVPKMVVDAADNVKATNLLASESEFFCVNLRIKQLLENEERLPRSQLLPMLLTVRHLRL